MYFIHIHVYNLFPLSFNIGYDVIKYIVFALFSQLFDYFS